MRELRDVMTVLRSAADRRSVAPASLLMVGPFPPPLHGLSKVNEAVAQALHSAGVEPEIEDTAASTLDRSLSARLGRLALAFDGLARMAIRRNLHGGTLYMSVSGGWGKVYEVGFVLLARLRGMRVFLHHHSFAYLSRYSRLARVLALAAGERAVHVVQSPGMAKLLGSMYGVNRVVPVSNAVFLMGEEPEARVRRCLRTIGFISNIAEEKGIFEFLDLAEAVREADLPLRVPLAGPFQDARTERLVRERLSGLPEVEYVGPRYGREKEEFFASIDALVFPTRYVNEAEPLVCHEAMSRGIPVIACGRGCIPEIVGDECGLVVDPAESFVPGAMARIEEWVGDPVAFEAASRAAARRFREIYADNQRRWEALLAEMTGSDTAGLSVPEEKGAWTG